MEDDAPPRVIVVMPAYNAAQTLVRTYGDIPADVVDHIILVDDLSKDDTVAIAKLLGIQVVVHRQNTGYGGNQKTCYDTALAEDAQVVVMVHPDYQYDATRIPELIAPILAGEADMMLGSRFLSGRQPVGTPRGRTQHEPGSGLGDAGDAQHRLAEARAHAAFQQPLRRDHQAVVEAHQRRRRAALAAHPHRGPPGHSAEEVDRADHLGQQPRRLDRGAQPVGGVAAHVAEGAVEGAGELRVAGHQDE